MTNHDDLLRGLSSRPLRIPSKYFYDDRGSALFDAICDLPEYYPTRTEQALLDRVSERIAALTRARQMVELGSGTARKTRLLIQALLQQGDGLHYTPVDISRYALEQAAESLSRDFPDLRIDGVLCDYTDNLDGLSPDPGCLAVFLGSTIGNFEHDRSVALLRRLRGRLNDGDHFLLGVDLVKPVETLEAAYNDSRGLTAEFNRNILRSVNRAVEGDFEPETFRHLARFDQESKQIEMYLVAEEDVRVRLEGPGLELEMRAGERILTEISRKFDRPSTAGLLEESGFTLDHWFESPEGYFALALARAAADDDPGAMWEDHP